MAQRLKKKNTSVKKVIKKAKRQQAKSSNAKENTNFSIPNTGYVEAVGRRKVATARVRIYDKPGDFVVNDKVVGEYFDTIPQASVLYNKPLEILDLVGKHAITVKVSGSGISSQLDAMVHGMARALVAINIDNRPHLKAAGLLTRDDRMKETRKIGTGGKARRKRQSPKR